MKQYYISNGQEPAGPFVLTDLTKHGLKPSSMIWHEGMPDWQPAIVVSEVHALLPKLPPPLRKSPPPIPQNSSAHNSIPSAPTYKTPIYTPPLTQKKSAVLPDRKLWIIGGGTVAALVAFLLLTSGVLRTPSISYVEPVTTTTQPFPSVDDAALQAQQAAEAEKARLAQVEIERKEQQRAWNRQHFLEYLAVDMLPYTPGTFGGISNAYFQFNNKSGYRLRNNVIAVNYFKANGGLYTTRYVLMNRVDAHATVTWPIPNTDRGTRVYCSIHHIEAPGLEYVYDAQQEADAAEAAADYQANPM
ncbi:DUF4339 domain-containing protein [Hymenobacter sp. ASUV-10]|uniref:DUF4339 domain-containing protein n=1 Tax=Hymenobacter aranciens TaxID=3063996 RepID=A0ABT9BDN7_9BACT|nr:DUF4339 domain-containing protein [Hymenobacter sp. ASUV-10]MDO7876367.1 DUF4339 domain-containing protein [Hymenobacter sp. ASUV-10]